MSIMPHFQLSNERLLALGLQKERVLVLAGSMVAYTGTVSFEKSLMGGEGLFGVLKRSVSNESFNLMICQGTGTVYVAHQAREVTVVTLNSEKIFVESSCILALETSLKTNTAFAGLRGASAGQGLFTTTVEGRGQLALMSCGHLLEFEVTSAYPLFVDPDAFVGFKGQLSQEFVFDVNWKTLRGKASGESYQLKFSGEGTVYVQSGER